MMLDGFHMWIAFWKELWEEARHYRGNQFQADVLINIPLNYAQQYSLKNPKLEGLKYSSSPTSAERFRLDWLLPPLQEGKKVRVVLDGTLAPYDPEWIFEAIIRVAEDFDLDYLKEHMMVDYQMDYLFVCGMWEALESLYGSPETDE